MVTINIWYSESEEKLPIERIYNIADYNNLTENEFVEKVLKAMSLDETLLGKKNITWQVKL